MLKKILVILLLIISSLFIFNNNLFAEKTCTGTGANRLEGDAAKNCLNRPEFTIDITNFSPGSQETLVVAKEGNGNTKDTVNAMLGMIIKNLIIVFGVLSLLVMTIGGGFMIFHAGEESLLTKGKLMFKYGVVSLALALASGVMVKMVNWLLY